MSSCNKQLNNELKRRNIFINENNHIYNSDLFNFISNDKTNIVKKYIQKNDDFNCLNLNLDLNNIKTYSDTYNYYDDFNMKNNFDFNFGKCSSFSKNGISNFNNNYDSTENSCISPLEYDEGNCNFYNGNMNMDCEIDNISYCYDLSLRK
jgi:hypothetical protein